MILGITGSFGSGKSSVTARFAAAGWRTFDADAFCRNCYETAAPEFAASLRERWGDAVFASDGTIDRKQVAARVFAAPDELEFLTRLLYPNLRRELERTLEAWRSERCSGAVEMPLLYEEKMEMLFDAVLVVWADPQVRQSRLAAKRGFDPEEFRRREARQLAADEKLERADCALINNGTPEELDAQFRRLLTRLEARR